ncbi:hypothetical protein [Streptomyces pseudovenezuelae]
MALDVHGISVRAPVGDGGAVALILPELSRPESALLIAMGSW